MRWAPISTLLLFVGEDRVLNRLGTAVMLGGDVLRLCGMGKEFVIHGFFHFEARPHGNWGVRVGDRVSRESDGVQQQADPAYQATRTDTRAHMPGGFPRFGRSTPVRCARDGRPRGRELRYGDPAS